MGMNDDDSELNESRGFACEIVAFRFLTFLSEKELIDYLLFELPQLDSDQNGSQQQRRGATSASSSGSNESTALLQDQHENYSGNHFKPPRRANAGSSDETQVEIEPDNKVAEEDPTANFAGMNALEIAAVANAKKFLSQRIVQKLVQDIWQGDVIFWENLSVHAVKKARVYNKRVADVYSRLRVPKYQKAFQVAFFALFLLLYYAVLVERNPKHVTPTEVFLYIWIAAFAYDEFGEIQDAGVLFYQTDFWSLWDIGIIGVGIAFLIASKAVWRILLLRFRPKISLCPNTTLTRLMAC